MKACRNSPRISSFGCGRPAASAPSRVTTASPISCTCEPSALLIARRAVATVSAPRSLNWRMRGWSISVVSVSGKWRASVPRISLRSRPFGSKDFTEKPRRKESGSCVSVRCMPGALKLGVLRASQ
jgi:hypothetical protein